MLRLGRPPAHGRTLKAVHKLLTPVVALSAALLGSAGMFLLLSHATARLDGPGLLYITLAALDLLLAAAIPVVAIVVFRRSATDPLCRSSWAALALSVVVAPLGLIL